MDAVALEDIHERNHQKRYRVLEKFIECNFPAAARPNFERVPDFEKMEWFNTILSQLWPFIGNYVKRIMKDQIEPQIAQTVPHLKMRFVSFDVGKARF